MSHLESFTVSAFFIIIPCLKHWLKPHVLGTGFVPMLDKMQAETTTELGPIEKPMSRCLLTLLSEEGNNFIPDNNNNNNNNTVRCSFRNIGCLWVLSTSVYQPPRTVVHSSLPTSLVTDLLQLVLGFPLFLLPWGFHSRAAFGTSPSSFLNVWPIHLNFLFLISKFISSWPVALHNSLLEIIFGHHILRIYLRHGLQKFVSYVEFHLWQAMFHIRTKVLISHRHWKSWSQFPFLSMWIPTLYPWYVLVFILNKEQQTRSKQWMTPIKFRKFMGLRSNIQSFWV
jgi:hypothetical protein